MVALLRSVLGGALPSERFQEPYEVELLDDGEAEVLSLDARRSLVVPRSLLPTQAREGDIIDHGQVDVAATLAERFRIAELQARARPVPPGLDLDAEGGDDDKERLTRPEKP